MAAKLTHRLLQAAAAVALAHALPASALTLLQAYQGALEHDPVYLSAIQDSNSGKEYAVLGRASLLPQMSASYSASRNHADLTAPTAIGTRNTTHPTYYSRSAALQVRQPLFSLDALARYQQGKAQSSYSEAQFDLRVQEMILRVTGAYIDALYASEQLALAKAQRDTFVEQHLVNRRLFEKGEGTRTDMLETESRLELAEAQVLEAQDNQSSAQATLAAMVGAEAGELDQLRPEFRIAPLPEGGFEALKQAALDRNPEIASQRFAIEAAKQELNKARAGHAPRLDFVGTYSKSNAETLNTYNQESTNRSIGLQLNVPLYSGGSVNAQSRQAAAGLEKARSDLQARTDKVVVGLHKDYAALVSSMARIRALDKAVVSGRLLVLATEQSIKGGVRINLDLLNARQQLFTSERDLAQARFAYLMNRLKVQGAAGALGPDTVREIAGYFR